MSHQGQEGWYPECEVCGCGNLGEVVCYGCYQKANEQKVELSKDDINNIITALSYIDNVDGHSTGENGQLISKLLEILNKKQISEYMTA